MSDKELRFEALLDELQAAIAHLSQIPASPEKPIFRFESRPKQGHSLRASRLSEPDYGALASQLYDERRKRDQLLGLPGVFGEPAWDILLDLTIAYERRQKLSVSSVLIGAAAPGTTGLRYIAILEKRGLLLRTPDENDGRRSWVQLTEAGVRMMRSYIDCIATNPNEVSNVGHRPIIAIDSPEQA